MANYRFYSRRNGYNGGIPVRYYETSLIEDTKNLTNIFIDKSGKKIVELLKIDLKNLYSKDIDTDTDTDRDRDINEYYKKIKLFEYCEKYPTWFYYPDKTVITDMRIYS